jgi:hypothetical protein
VTWMTLLSPCRRYAALSWALLAFQALLDLSF